MDDIIHTENEPHEDIKRPSYCFFSRGGKRYYIPVDALKEVVELKELFPVPLAPEYIKGAIPLRGSVIPVIDLLEIDNRPEIQGKADMLIVVEAMKEQIGFLAEGLPGFDFGESVPDEHVIDINKFFETYMVRETS